MAKLRANITFLNNEKQYLEVIKFQNDTRKTFTMKNMALIGVAKDYTTIVDKNTKILALTTNILPESSISYVYGNV